MSSTFRLIEGMITGKFFAEGTILSNPIAELMIDLLITVLVQSSSTSTSIVISMVSSSRKCEEFCLAFGGATVHDMFNWLTLLIFIINLNNMLYHLTNSIIKLINLKRNPNSNPQFHTVITKSLTERILDKKKAIQSIALSNASSNISLLKRYCSFKNVTYNDIFIQVSDTYCSFLFAKVQWADWLSGLVLLIIQSSSIFTSTLTPLVGLDIIIIERVYPFTLDSNISTTITGIMAVLTVTSEKDLRNPLQITFCHIFFNIIEILIWFPIPFMRFPIPMAKKLGEITAKYRWFAVLYIISSFFLISLIVFGLSLARWRVFAGVLGSIKVHILNGSSLTKICSLINMIIN
ncbi:unnamed protein product [Rotaria sp. Silwood1]|nr:unnamed protein product [Rotaria sp. Silwood1]CAF1600225.1 unnamed protein product [Rotaria sp. Silwood1]CAF3779346.1 unnamed protein product [Rotaria sp. Silwood1]